MGSSCGWRFGKEDKYLIIFTDFVSVVVAVLSLFERCTKKKGKGALFSCRFLKSDPPCKCVWQLHCKCVFENYYLKDELSLKAS